ncbi:hypothetical protein CANINC_005078 [Pichia inconspicua]|uniref:Uncharacterized protein n=1 Tax=Pichia inconspicua TaxID=52247 RepID=A0A4T0WUA8_9ASCO|nr:hypothetical protein CANINC_005078 [[Candida] inconspicua]
MKNYDNTYKTKQMKEREVVRERKSQMCNKVSSRIPRTHYISYSSERSCQVKAAAIPPQRRLNLEFDKKLPNHSSGSNTTIHVQTPQVSHITERHIPNYSIFSVQSRVKDVKNNTNKPKFNASDDYELDNEIFRYELSLGNEKWEDVLPHLSNSPFASHSRLLYPAPLLCDVTRHFKKKTCGKQSS